MGKQGMASAVQHLFKVSRDVNSRGAEGFIQDRLRLDGKFFARGGRRVHICGVTYGPFALSKAGQPFPEPRRVAEDFACMRTAGINSVRTYHVPPEWLFHLAGENGVNVFVDVPWPKHLCFLDSVGYAERRANKTPRALFPDVLGRYLDAVEPFIESRRELDLKMGKCTVLEGDARRLEVDDGSVDGILFSPPYSFAIDYLENDRPQLELLGVDMQDLKAQMVGLRGEGRNEEQRVAVRLREYFADMRQVLSECSRALRQGGYCTVIVGSNTNQTGGITLEDRLIEIGESEGLKLDFQIMREIEGIRNTMREEYLLFFKKV